MRFFLARKRSGSRVVKNPNFPGFWLRVFSLKLCRNFFFFANKTALLSNNLGSNTLRPGGQVSIVTKVRVLVSLSTIDL